MSKTIIQKVHNVKDEEVEIEYTQLMNVGHGSFGTVSRSQLLAPFHSTIAIKKVLQDKRFKNRELQIMKTLDNPYITKLHYYNYETDDSSQSSSSGNNALHTIANNKNQPSHHSLHNNNNLYLNLIMEFLPTTLYKRNQFYSLQKEMMPLNEAKLYLYQILQGLSYLHSKDICHRDIKPQNILVDYSKGIAKICDFGSAKILTLHGQNVSYICSRYYRAPELIFGATNYTTKIDIWSLGCVFAELLIGQPLFPGESGIDQLVEIIKILGTPTTEDILSMNNNYVDHRFPIIKKIPLVKIFKNLNDEQGLRVLEFLEGFLLFNPNRRFSASLALHDDWFEDLRA